MVPKLPSAFHRKIPSFRVSSIAPEHLDVSAIWYVLELTFVRKLFRELHLVLHENPLVWLDTAWSGPAPGGREPLLQLAFRGRLYASIVKIPVFLNASI